MSRQTVLLLGGGGHAAVVADAARACGWSVAGCLDDEPGTEAPCAAAGLARLGAIDDLPLVLAKLPHATAIHAAVGDPELRRAWFDRWPDIALATIIHPSAVVSPSAVIDVGVFIGPRAVVNARTNIERGVIVNSGAIIEHDCRLGAFCHIAPGAVLAGAVSVGPDSLIGVGAACRPGLRIGARAILGAGAVATADIPDGTRAVGIPASPVPSSDAKAADRSSR